MVREAVRKICRVFRELYVSLAKENEASKNKVRRLEADLMSKDEKTSAAEKSETQTLYKIKPSGQFNVQVWILYGPVERKCVKK